MISLVLPFPPSANTYYRNFRGRMVLSKQGRDYREKVADIVAELQAEKQEGRLALFVTLFPPTRRKLDCDNRIKPIQDALEHAGVFDDDEQIDAIAVFREVIKSGGEARIIVCQASSKKAAIFKDLSCYELSGAE